MSSTQSPGRRGRAARVEIFPRLLCKCGVTSRRWPWILLLLVGAGCPSRSLPPAPVDDPKHDTTSPCGQVFNDPKVHGGSGCCFDQTAGLLKSSDVAAACGLPVAGYAGQ